MISSESLIRESQLIQTFYSAISEADDTLYDEFPNVKNILLQRSTITQNRPLFYGLIENLLYFKENGDIIHPYSFEELKSDRTFEMCNEFLQQHKKSLEDVDLLNVMSIRKFLSEIKTSGIRLLVGLRKTAGCIFIILNLTHSS